MLEPVEIYKDCEIFYGGAGYYYFEHKDHEPGEPIDGCGREMEGVKREIDKFIEELNSEDE